MRASGLITGRSGSIALVAVIAALTSASPLAHAGKKQKKALAEGIKLYQSATYEEAVFVLEELAARPKLDDDIKAEALKYVAFCYFLLGAAEQAKDAWLRLRQAAPKLTLDPVNESPEIVEFFKKLDTAEGTTAAAEPGKTDGGGPAKAKKADPDRENWEKAPVVEKDVRGCGIFLCLLPVGIGQFANDKIIKGVVFAVLEPLFLSLNIAFWYMNDTDKVHQQSGPDRYRDLALANERYVYQMVFFGLTLGTVLIGILDAFIFY